MRAVIHLGLHKTATTAFQIISLQFRQKLLSRGILYPHIKEMGPSHNFLALQAQKGDETLLRQIIKSSTDALNSSGTLLLSAENLEGALCSQFDLSRMHNILSEVFDEIQYVVVVRDQFEYFVSLYGEMSKWGVLLSWQSMASSILSRKYLHLSSDLYEWGFCFDPFNGAEEIRKTLGSEVVLVSYPDFVSGFPGRALLSWLLNGETICSDELVAEIDNWYNMNPSLKSVNSSLSDYQVELNYSASFLGYDNEKLKRDDEARAMVMLLASKRLSKRRETYDHIRESFRIAFPA